MKKLPVFASILPLALWAGGAAAGGGSYTGNYKVTLTHDVYLTTKGYTGHGPNSTHCLALTDDGNVGWMHSGYVVIDNNDNTSGQFAVINNTILIYVAAQGSDESIASYVFSASARDGKIAAHGAFDYIEGGTSYDADKVAFGARGSC